MKADSESWIAAAQQAVRSKQAAVLVSIVGVQGSSPREPGARMLVSAETATGSVGGGVLEHMAIQRARSDLRGDCTDRRLLSFPLDPDSQQCCGGIVVLFFETLGESDSGWLDRLKPDVIEQGVLLMTPLSTPGGIKSAIVPGESLDAAIPAAAGQWLEGRSAFNDAALIDDQDQQFLFEYLVRPCFNVLLFGAGHVGRAVVRALALQQCKLLWIDARKDEFPEQIPDNVTPHMSSDISGPIEEAPAGSFLLVMTHRHPLDFEICKAALTRDDFALVGLIGSTTKRRRFVRALEAEGLNGDQVASLCCPIGIEGIHGKQPEVIAASVVAQLLQLSGSSSASPARRLGIGTKQAEASTIGSSF